VLTVTLSDSNWKTIYAFLKTCPDLYVSDERKCRRFVEALLWVARSGAPWRLLPEAYGKWNSIYKRFARWSERRVWQRLFEHCADEPDREWLLLDSTIIRAHPCAAGALKKTVDRRPQPSGAVVAASAPRRT
jgi:transposase